MARKGSAPKPPEPTRGRPTRRDPPGTTYVGVSAGPLKKFEPKIVYPSVGPLKKFEPKVVGVDGRDALKRLRARPCPQSRAPVVAAELWREDADFAGRLSQRIRAIIEALLLLEHVTSLCPSPDDVVALRDGLRAALDDYLAQLQKREVVT